VYDRLDCTRNIIESLTGTIGQFSFECIIVNDASKDDTAQYLESIEDERIHTISHLHNQGYAKSTNDGARIAQGEYLVLLNNDLQLSPGWLEPMLEVMQEKPDAGAIGNIQYRLSNGIIDHAGIVFDLVGLPDHYGKNYPYLPAFICREFPAVTGACMLIRREVFNKLGGLDESYRNGCEDVDLCLRLRQNGYRNFVAGNSRIGHHVSASPGRHDRDADNNRILLQKWGDDLVKLGARDWPFQYLMRYWNRPWLYNGTKLVDAFARLLRLRSGDSKWARQKRARLLK